MLWLQPLPWVRWLSVALIFVTAAWIEFRPDPTVSVPFATETIAPGEAVDQANSEFLDVPEGELVGASLGDVINRTVFAGEPILTTHVDTNFGVVPNGWWVVPVALPEGAQIGDPVRLVMLDSGTEVEGIVANPGSDDPFSSVEGGVALPPEGSTEAAIASASGRIAVLLSTG